MYGRWSLVDQDGQILRTSDCRDRICLSLLKQEAFGTKFDYLLLLIMQHSENIGKKKSFTKSRPQDPCQLQSKLFKNCLKGESGCFTLSIHLSLANPWFTFESLILFETLWVANMVFHCIRYWSQPSNSPKAELSIPIFPCSSFARLSRLLSYD